MSLNVAGLTAYVDETRMQLIKKMILGGRSTQFLTIQPDIKSTASINLLSSTLVAQGGGCGFSNSGTTLTFQTAPANSAEITYRYLPLGGAYTSANFTGDGSDTTFTIDAGRAVNDVLVVVNGLTLVPTDDYTISGTTLTFASAPANLAEITVRYLRLWCFRLQNRL